MNILFTEVEEWEKETLKKTFPDAVFTRDKLTQENVKTYAESEIISSFIYSKFDEATL